MSAKTDAFFREIEPRLLLLTFPEALNDEETRQLLADFYAAYSGRDEPFAVVLDAGAVAEMRPSQRKLFAAHDQHGAAFDRKWCAGVALVMKSTIQRGIATAVYWISPPVYPYAFFPDFESGLKWAKSQLGQRIRNAPAT